MCLCESVPLGGGKHAGVNAACRWPLTSLANQVENLLELASGALATPGAKPCKVVCSSDNHFLVGGPLGMVQDCVAGRTGWEYRGKWTMDTAPWRLAMGQLAACSWSGVLRLLLLVMTGCCRSRFQAALDEGRCIAAETHVSAAFYRGLALAGHRQLHLEAQRKTGLVQVATPALRSAADRCAQSTGEGALSHAQGGICLHVLHGESPEFGLEQEEWRCL